MGNLIGSFGRGNPSPVTPSRPSLAATGEVQRQRKRGRKGGGGKEEGDGEEVEELSPRRSGVYVLLTATQLWCSLVPRPTCYGIPLLVIFSLIANSCSHLLIPSQDYQ